MIRTAILGPTIRNFIIYGVVRSNRFPQKNFIRVIAKNYEIYLSRVAKSVITSSVANCGERGTLLSQTQGNTGDTVVNLSSFTGYSSITRIAILVESFPWNLARETSIPFAFF